LIERSTVLTGRGARKSTVLEIAGDFDHIHIAAHAVTYPVYGEKSALVLAADEHATGETEIFSALLGEDEIGEIDLSDTKLVVLSSCESAHGRPSMHGNDSGLARAFIKAGVQTVIAAMWPIEDTSAVTLMSELYKSLMADGIPPSLSLRRSQVHIIQSAREAGNLHGAIEVWAPFVAFAPLTDQDPPKR
jgi:CHAT domain-containing protein